MSLAVNSRSRRLLPLLLMFVVTACASGGGATGSDHIAPDFDFNSISSVHLDTPIRMTVRGAGNADVTRAVELELRDFFRQELAWARSPNAAGADVVARFELTDWESAVAGSRVGGTLELVRPADGTVVYRATHVYPSRFGAPAPGTARDLLPDLFLDLISAARN